MTVSAPTILTASPDDIAFDYEGSTSYSDILHLVGTAAANSTITIYDGATALGTATTNSQGAWTFTTPVLADGAHSFTATATSGGSTSAASPALTETVVGSIANFSPLTDQWSSPVSVGGMHYYVENANTNGNAPWAITEVNDHTLQFQVQPGDLWQDNASHRSEISGATIFNSNQTVNLSYQFEVQPGFNDTAGNVAWQILGQFHGDDNNQTYLNISGGNPILAFHLTGPNGLGEGDYLAIQGFYALTGQTSFSEATLPGNPLNGYLYVSPTPIVRGQSYNIQLEADFANNSSGFLEVWINGTEVVNYHGPLGYGGGVYWKEGVYEGWSSNQTITVDYSNTVVTTAPGSPLILGNTVNGNEAMLNGTAQANSTVTVYDGATKLGTATTNSSGAWFFETAALSSGSHNLTATATDSAGNVSAASSASNANIVAFTGPIITNVATSAANGETVLGNTITFTLTMSSAVTVTGTPTLSLNDGGTATYKSGTGTNSLTFSYTVGASDTSVTGLAITGANLPGGATIKDGSGNAAILAGAGVQFPGVVIDSQPVQTPVFGAPVANSNGTFTFTGTAGANTTVYFETPYTGGLGSAVVNSSGQWTFTSPTLTYNTWNTLQAYDVNSLGDMSAIGVESGGGFGDNVNLPDSPTITGNALTGSAVTLYGMVSSGESISSVAVYDGATKLGTTTINSDGSWSFTTGTLTNGVHAFTATSTNASGTSGASAADDITIGAAAAPVGPTISSIVESPSSGDLNAGKTVTLTLDMSGNVTVNTTGGTPTLTLNDGTTATYISGSGSSALLFSYTVAAGQNTAALAATAVNLNGATITDGSGNAANLSVTGLTQTGPQIDTTTPTVASVATSGTGITAGSGDLTTGNVVTLTVNLSEAVTVNTTGGTPTLTLNDGGTATYTGGTANALTFSYTVAAGQATADLAVTAVNLNSATVTDGAGNAANLTGAVTNPAGTLQIDTTTPTVASVATSGTGITAGSGDLTTGNVVTLTVNLSEAVTVNTTGGTPTLTLNDGGTATYTGGTGTNALTFSYTVAAGQATSDLAVTAVNLNSATVTDGAGNAANLTGAVTNPAGTLQIDTTTPTVASVATSGTGITAGSGDLTTGNVVTLTVNLSEAVTVNTTGGTPTLTLNDGGTATYTGGTGTSALTFSYTVAAGQATSDLAVTAVNLNSATIKDGAGNAANLTGAVTNPAGTLQIDTTTPTVSSVATSGTGITAGAGDLTTGAVVTLTVNLSEAVTVNTTGGTPTLTLNDGGTATYTGGTGTNALTFSYTVAAGQNTADLAVTAVNLNSATVTDGAGNAANLTGAVTNPAGTLQIDTTTPTVASVATSGTGITAGSGDLTTGNVVTLTVNLSEAVTVNTTGGTPTLTLNDGGTATYTGGTGTSALTFSYTVAAGQATSDLAVTAVNLNSATIKDGAGNAANLTGAVTNPAGTLQIDTTTPTVSSVATSGTGITAGSGDLTTGSVVTLTVNLSEAVTVNTTGGTPTLTLNDGGTATYTGGTGTNALTFSYTVAAGQNTADLAVTAVNLNSATIKDGAGNAANLTGAVTNPAGTLQIDTTTPTVSSVATSGTGITAGAGDLTTGAVVTLTVNLSEAVTVNTTGGTPTLTLNDGGTATYTGGTGTNALTFSYTVAAGQNTADLAVTAVNLNSATVTDGAGNAANLTGAVTNPAGTLQIDTTTPTVASVATSGTGITAGSGDLTTGNVVTLTVNLSEAVTVNTTGGTPTLTLNDGGTATYTGGTGTNALTFSYTVAAGQNTSDLAVTAVNLNAATVTDGAGNAANLSVTGLTQTGPQIDTTTPTVASVATSGTGITAGSGDLTTGSVVTLTVNLSEAVTVNTTGGTPTLTLNDGGTATYTGGTGTNALTFSYTVAAGQNTADLAVTAVNLNSATIKDGAGNAANLTGAVTNPAGTLQIDTTTPTVASVATSGTGITAGAGDLTTGAVVTLTVNLSEAVTVNTTGGTPTLTLNDGGTATYTGGTGTNALTFSYTVAAGQNTADLAVTAVNLNSATVTDGAGNAANLTGAVTNPAGTLQIDTTTPTVASVTATAGDYNAGNTLTLTLNMSEAVNVTGTPTLALNDGGTATYVSGSGTNALTFSYTVGAGDSSVSALAITQVNLPNGAMVSDGAGNAANLSGALTTLAGLQIDPTSGPTLSSITESPSSGDLSAGNVVTLTVNLSEAVTVNTTDGTPTLTLNDGGIATYTGGTGTNVLTFSYTVAAGQNTAGLAATAVNLNSATITDGSGNAANLSVTGLTQTGPQIDTTVPVISSIAESPSNGDLNAGKIVTYTISLSEAVTVNTTGGSPTLALNDGGTATYVSGSGTDALTFSYTVLPGQNTPDLMVSAVNLNGATVQDGAGNAASLSLTGLTQGSPQIDTVTPVISAIVESPSSGDLNAGKTVTLTVDMSEVVTVNTTGGTPKLTLNDGGVATYVSGTGTNALTFTYTVAAGQNTAALKATALSLNGATMADGAGNAANLSLTGLTQAGPQIDTTTPVISAIVESPSSGDLNAGKTVTLTLGMSEAVTVNTTGGTPTLTLNDGGVATYVSGTGTSTLTFSYTVAAGQNTAALKATALNLNSATITDGAGSAANLSLTGLTQTGPQIDTTAPSAPHISFDTVIVNRAIVVGTATADSVIRIYEGTTLVGTTSSNSKGNWVFESSPLTKGAHTFTATATDTAGNVSAPSIAFDPDVGAGPVVNAVPVEVGNQYYLYNNSGSDVALTYAGAIVTAGEFGGWTPIAAVQTATGYDVAWQMTGANEYTVWATDSSGNAIANLTGGPVSGTSYALESIESTFNQDLNGDGVIGVPTTVIQIVGNQYYLDGISGSGPALQLAGGVVTVNEIKGWTPIGAVQTASGYDVAWKMTGANEYTVWATDSSGNAIANLTGGPVSGTSYALESIESTFNQDLNGDGTIGLTTTVIQVDGSTSLTEVANRFYLDGIGGSGPALQYAGADVTAGEFGGWTPIGAVQTASGYDVAWKMTGANEYTVWATNSSGNTISNLTGAVSGTSTALESLESTFNQDLNGDGVIGLYAAPGTTLQIGNPLAGTSATIGTGATLELAGADTGSVTFASSKGTLVLDHSSTFGGQIIGFTGDGTLSGSDQIDMKDINFSTVQVSYTNGVLTVRDGVDTASLNFSGSYVMANFSLASDGTGGTIVYDPPVANFGPASGTGADSGSPSVTDPPLDGPKNALGNAGATVTDPQNGGGSSQPLTDPPTGGAGFQNGGASGTPPVTNPPTGGTGFQNGGAGGTPPVTDLPTGGTGFQNGSLLAALAADGQITLGYLLDGHTDSTLSATNGSQGANIALLGSYMASSFPAPTGSLAGATLGADGGPIGSSSSLLTHPQHA